MQATDRIAMLHAMGTLLQQTVTLASLSAGVIVYSPWLFLALVACITPAFLGESHFAFLGYSLAHSLTPVRRELDYLRVLATSKESAKEVKIFGLAGYLRGRFAEITGGLIERKPKLARKRLWGGALLTLVGSLGYYGGYAYLVIQALQGRLSVGSLTFLAGALAASSSQIQAIFSTFASIADQSLFLTDLVKFFAVRPRIHTRFRTVCPRPARSATASSFKKYRSSIRAPTRLVLRDLDFRIHPGERVALVGANGQGKTTFVKLLSRALRAVGRPHSAGRRGSARVSARRSPPADRRHFPGFHALRSARARRTSPPGRSARSTIARGCCAPPPAAVRSS